MRSKFFPASIRLSVIAVCCVLLTQGCTITPTAVRDTAASLSTGELQIDTGVFPTPALNFAYGITDDVDIGLDMERVPNVWAKYSFAPSATGAQWAVNAGAFRSSIDTVNDSSNYDRDVYMNGVYLGGIFTQTFAGGSSFNLAYRYNALKYDAFSTREEGGLGFFASDYGFLRRDNYSIVNVSSKDLSGIGTLSATWSILWKPQAHIHFGASCQLYHTSNNRGVESSHCTPVLGIAFFRR